jgi:hypothetical protein
MRDYLPIYNEILYFCHYDQREVIQELLVKSLMWPLDRHAPKGARNDINVAAARNDGNQLIKTNS